MSSSTTVSWDVVDNGLDFLHRAVAELGDAEPNNKQSTIHLFSAIEVLITARLIREHWTLACGKVDGATLGAFEAGNVNTVDALLGLKRLQTVVGLQIGEQQVNKVRAVQKLRNRAVHFAFVEENALATRATLGKGLDFALWFLGKHVRPGAPDDEAESIDELMEEIAGALSSIKEVVKARLKSLNIELDAAELLLVCPRCAQGCLMFPADAAPTCLFCFWESKGEDGADEYASTVLGVSRYAVVKDGGEWPVHQCPECDLHALVDGLELVKDVSKSYADVHDPYMPYVYGCFNCCYLARRIDLDRCGYCGEVTGSEMGVCSSCFANYH